ncbi:hypothetical protein [Streptomyces vastus]|uniref:Ricin B lectin domain-containing protein n=1 Tax=Streptomyces vastus TaxID=285451 RepID=A0ABN3RRC4_9ACTN
MHEQSEAKGRDSAGDRHGGRLRHRDGGRCCRRRGIRADIRADANRDGAVDVSGGSDFAGKTTWRSGRGAVFLPNIGDKQRRCKTRTPDGRWLSNAQLEACNDAQGNVVRAPEYLAPLRTVPVDNVSDAANGGLQLVGAGKSKVRLFLKRGDTWT